MYIQCTHTYIKIKGYHSVGIIVGVRTTRLVRNFINKQSNKLTCSHRRTHKNKWKQYNAALHTCQLRYECLHTRTYHGRSLDYICNNYNWLHAQTKYID